MEKTYLTRFVDDKFKTALATLVDVYIDGPKWCGKSTMPGRLAKKNIKTTEKRLAKPTI